MILLAGHVQQMGRQAQRFMDVSDFVVEHFPFIMFMATMTVPAAIDAVSSVFPQISYNIQVDSREGFAPLDECDIISISHGSIHVFRVEGKIMLAGWRRGLTPAP